uniref:Uncharacterized protein n=1 Tax=Panagrellus redivivus TaxID=6233 RepID=A0A7E4UL94_PANRE
MTPSPKGYVEKNAGGIVGASDLFALVVDDELPLKPWAKLQLDRPPAATLSRCCAVLAAQQETDLSEVWKFDELARTVLLGGRGLQEIVLDVYRDYCAIFIYLSQFDFIMLSKCSHE